MMFAVARSITQFDWESDWAVTKAYVEIRVPFSGDRQTIQTDGPPSPGRQLLLLLLILQLVKLGKSRDKSFVSHLAFTWLSYVASPTTPPSSGEHQCYRVQFQSSRPFCRSFFLILGQLAHFIGGFSARDFFRLDSAAGGLRVSPVEPAQKKCTTHTQPIASQPYRYPTYFPFFLRLPLCLYVLHMRLKWNAKLKIKYTISRYNCHKLLASYVHEWSLALSCTAENLPVRA